MYHYIYDIETYPNIFTFACRCYETRDQWIFEISDRKNDIEFLKQLIHYIGDTQGIMVGYNNEFFDYPIIHHLVTEPGSDHRDAFKACESIIGKRSRKYNVWPNRRLAKQIDLLKIHHFDNKGVSLKLMEYNLKMDSIRDLPFEPGRSLSNEEMDTLISYNWHDIDATEEVFKITKKEIEFRDKLSAQYDFDFTNCNDTKIGEEYFIMKLEEAAPGSCYIKPENGFGRGERRGTPRPKLALKDAIFDYVKFEEDDFNRVLDIFRNKVIRDTKGELSQSAIVKGLEYKFGTGGMHASIEGETIHTDSEATIVDLDVASYYPNLGIANRIYPEHLSETFCDVYEEVYNMRKQFLKGTMENALFKLALNGTYGKSNSVWSPMFDPLYTMKITLNGQFLICMLAEQLLKIPGLKMIQVNTDGLTVKCPNYYLYDLQNIRIWWEKLTKLELEHAVYKRMFVPNVNNYIAEGYGRKVKHVGKAFKYNIEWHQNFSQLIVHKVVEQFLVFGKEILPLLKGWPNPENYHRVIDKDGKCTNEPDIYDFFLRAKVKRSDILMYGDKPIQRISRYYVAKNGEYLTKLSPPTKGKKEGAWKKKDGVSDKAYHAWENDSTNWDVNAECDEFGVPHNPDLHTKGKTKYEQRITSFHKGYKVCICNDTKDIDLDNIDYDYYLNEVLKIVTPLI